MCVIMATIVFKCSSVQCHDFLLSFYRGHFVAGWGSNGWADTYVHRHPMTSIDTQTQTPGTSHDIHGTSEIS